MKSVHPGLPSTKLPTIKRESSHPHLKRAKMTALGKTAFPVTPNAFPTAEPTSSPAMAFPPSTTPGA